jgi:sensor histidine kinase YesM
MLAFTLFEQWPRRLPRWIARWVVQVLAVALTIPACTIVIYLASTESGQPPFWLDEDRLGGFGLLTVFGLLLAPWVALGALVRQKEALARHQALAFDLERSELQRRALDARLRLLQSQVEPHFLFNTLANIRALVAAGSDRASTVLDSLIAYLRAAVPRLHETTTTLGQELDLVRAYLELMHMRMPDRLQFSIQADPATLPLRCPPTSLLTLVENAVRHGIDPGVEGGRIDVAVTLSEGRCRARVSDTGVGFGRATPGLGTGLSNLRERLQLAFAGAAALRIEGIEPHGTRVDIEFPVQTGAPR